MQRVILVALDTGTRWQQ